MTLADNKRLVQGIWPSIIAADWPGVAAAYHRNVTYHGPGGEVVHGRDQLIELTKVYRTAFPDLGFDILHCLAEGDMVATRGRGYGTNLGPLRTVAPTGRPLTIEIMYFMRIEDGQVIEEWEIFDLLDFRTQLGLPT